MDNSPVNRLRCLPKDFDPRSPTIDFDRTPIMIVDSPSSYSSTVSSSNQNVSFKSVLDGSYDSFEMNLSRDDPSPIVSSLSLEIETSCNADMECDNNNQEMNQILPEETTPLFDIEPKVIAIEEPKLPTPPIVKNVLTIREKQVAPTPPKPESAAPAAKKIIFSPSMAVSSPQKINTSFTCHMDCEDSSADQENIQQPMKVRSPRTPLASINKQSNSPLNILRAKQWKDFQEEREKRGLLDSENVLPPFKVTATSVPAKVPVRRRPLV